MVAAEERAKMSALELEDLELLHMKIKRRSVKILYYFATICPNSFVTFFALRARNHFVHFVLIILPHFVLNHLV